MNEIKIFENNLFGEIRTTMVDGEPWFVAADVCKALEMSDTHVALRRIDNDEKGRCSIPTPGGTQEMATVSEFGLYSLVLNSRKKEAKEFKRWITHEVIPSIRKHGLYATPVTIDAIIKDPDYGIRLLKELKQEQEARKLAEQKTEILAEANQKLVNLTIENQPKVEFANSVSAAGGEIGIGNLAKLMRQNGINIGQNRLYAEMREDGYIMKNSTLPTQYAMERGWFRIIERPITLPTGDVVMSQTTKVTTKGQIDLINKYFEKHIDDIF